MSEAEAPKPVEAVHPEAEVPATQPTEEKVEEKAEQKAEESTEKPEEKPEHKQEILKTTAKHDDVNPRNNRKFDPSTREVTDDPEAIRKQVEFYFGDWNFPQDKFMWESCGGSENKPMKVKTIHSFKRMRTSTAGFGHPNMSRMSLAHSEMPGNRASQFGGSQFFSPEEMVGMPSDDALLAEIRDILKTADLMTVTKKGIKQELERRFNVPLDAKRAYINSATEALLSGQL